MTISSLKIKIIFDPLTREYAGLTDLQVADSLNTIDRPNTMFIKNMPKPPISCLQNLDLKTTVPSLNASIVSLLL
ncbi:MAG: hypothetical protein GKS07_08455 [Nitrosopumilus sp.]|nr:MAG: hypothetical protein GKS07_08455 [Nitrosopumilus sp.]